MFTFDSSKMKINKGYFFFFPFFEYTRSKYNLILPSNRLHLSDNAWWTPKSIIPGVGNVAMFAMSVFLLYLR